MSGLVWVTTVKNSGLTVTLETTGQLKLTQRMLHKGCKKPKRRTLVLSVPEVSAVDSWKPPKNDLAPYLKTLLKRLTSSCSKSSMNLLLTDTKASCGHSWNQSIAVQLVTAGNLRLLTRSVEPTGEKHRTTCQRSNNEHTPLHVVHSSNFRILWFCQPPVRTLCWIRQVMLYCHRSKLRDQPTRWPTMSENYWNELRKPPFTFLTFISGCPCKWQALTKFYLM